jgi:hypothetical protein
VEILQQVQFIFENCDHHVDAHSNSDRCLESVGRRIEKILDPEILLDPLEKQFYLPSAFVEQGNGKRRQSKMDRQANENALHLGIEIAEAAQPAWISPPAVEGLRANDLIGAYASGGINNLMRLQWHMLQRSLDADDEESVDILKRM